MKFFFDNNLSPYLAAGIRKLRKGGAAVRVPWRMSGKFEQIRL
jgi:hypothetical protein